MNYTLRITLFLSLLLPVVAHAQQNVREASIKNSNWLLALSEPTAFDIASAVPSNEVIQPQEVVEEAEVEKEVYTHKIPAFAKTNNPSSLSLSELIQVATAYRLNEDARESVYWYGLVVSRSDDARNQYFYSKALESLKAENADTSLTSVE